MPPHWDEDGYTKKFEDIITTRMVYSHGSMIQATELMVSDEVEIIEPEGVDEEFHQNQQGYYMYHGDEYEEELF